MTNSGKAILRAILFAAFISGGFSFGQETCNARALRLISRLPQGKEFTFVAIGDPQGEYEAFRRILEESRKVKPAFIVVLGDLTAHSRREEFERYCEVVSSLDIPIVSVIGNHDVCGEGRAIFREMIGDSILSFDYGGRRFIILDSADGRLDPSQLDWLKQKLKTDLICYVFTHEPPFIGNWWAHSFRKGTKEFLKLVESSRVKRVFIGHLHIVDGFWRNGIAYTIVGSGGIKPALLPLGRAARGFLEVRVSGAEDSVSFHECAVERTAGVKAGRVAQ